MTARPLQATVTAAIETLVEADAVGLRFALDIAYEAGRMVGFDAGVEAEKKRKDQAVTADEPHRLQSSA